MFHDGVCLEFFYQQGFSKSANVWREALSACFMNLDMFRHPLHKLNTEKGGQHTLCQIGYSSTAPSTSIFFCGSCCTYSMECLCVPCAREACWTMQTSVHNFNLLCQAALDLSALTWMFPPHSMPSQMNIYGNSHFSKGQLRRTCYPKGYAKSCFNLLTFHFESWPTYSVPYQNTVGINAQCSLIKCLKLLRHVSLKGYFKAFWN